MSENDSTNASTEPTPPTRRRSARRPPATAVAADPLTTSDFAGGAENETGMAALAASQENPPGQGEARQAEDPPTATKPARKRIAKKAAGSIPADSIPAGSIPADSIPAGWNETMPAQAQPDVAMAVNSPAESGDSTLRRARRRATAPVTAPATASTSAPVSAGALPPTETSTAAHDSAGPGTAAPPDVQAPPPQARRAPRKRAAPEASAPPAVDPAPAQPETSQPVTSDPLAVAEPAPAQRPRRRGRSAAPAQFGSGQPEDAASVAAPVIAPVPVVVFAPPTDAAAEPTAPRSRRRRATAAQTTSEIPPVDDPAQIAVTFLDELDAVLDEDELVAQALLDETPDGEAASDDLASGDEGDSDRSDDESGDGHRRRRRRGRRGRGPRSEGSEDPNDSGAADAEGSPGGDGDSRPEIDVSAAADSDAGDTDGDAGDAESSSSRRRRRRRSRGSSGGDSSGEDQGEDDPPNTVVHVRSGRTSARSARSTNATTADPTDEVRGIRGSSRLEAKRQRRRDGRDNGRRRAPILTEAEFLARRESVERVMAVRQLGDRTQIAILEDGILVEHYVTRASATSYVGNVYLGRVQNVLPSMEAAFVDIGKGRNGVLYAGEVNWDAAGLEGKSRAIEAAMKSGDALLVQVTKDPIAHKGARLTSQVSLPGRFLVYVPGGGMTGISRKLPDTERTRLKAILKKIVPEDAGVIVRTAAEGASEHDLTSDVLRLQAQWEAISAHSARKADAPALVHGEPDLAIRVVRDVFNEDFTSMVVQGESTWTEISTYVAGVAPELAERISPYTGTGELFADLRVDEQLAKALDRKVWLPSGGSLVIDRTEAMTVVDVNTGKFTGSDGNLESTVTRNNIEAAEEIVRQLRLRDIGGIVVIDFIDMVLESNRDLVLRRLTECLGRDRTKHQVAEVTSLGLVQMTRKRVGEGLLEAFSEPCEHCKGRGVIIHAEPVNQSGEDDFAVEPSSAGSGRRARRGKTARSESDAKDDGAVVDVYDPQARRAAAAAMNAIARGTQHVDVPDPDPIPADDHSSGGEAGRSVVDLAESTVDVSGMPDFETLGDLETALLVDDGEAQAFESEYVVPADDQPDQAQPDQAQADRHVDAVDGRPTLRPRRRRAASRPAGPPQPAAVSG